MRIAKVMLVLSLISILFSGCAGYELSSGKKSLTVENISPDTFMVNFCGNAFMGQKEVEKYALQRAAEVAIEKKYTHFMVVNRRDDSKTCTIKLKGAYSSMPLPQGQEASVIEPSAYSKPNVVLTIRCFNKGKEMPKDAIDAEQYLRENFPGMGE